MEMWIERKAIGSLPYPQPLTLDFEP